MNNIVELIKQGLIKLNIEPKEEKINQLLVL